MDKKGRSVLLAVVLMGCFLLGLAVNQAGAANKRKIINLRVVAGHPPVAPWVAVMQSYLVPELEKRVKEQTTDYDVKCEELYGGSLAKLGEVLESVQSGMADIGMVVVVFEMSKLFLHNFPWWFPFGPSNVQEVLKVAHQTYDKFPVLDQILHRYNQKRLSLVGLATYDFVTNFPIHRLEDMKGKKMAHGGPMLPWLTALGSVAVQSRLNEAYTCLQTGVYDGWAMEPNSVVGFKLYEPAPYYTIANLGAGVACVITVNERKFKKLPKEVQKILVDVGADYERVNAESTMKIHDQKIKFMESQGVHVSTLSDTERQRFAKAMNDAGVADKMAKEADKKGWPGSEIAKFYVQRCIDDGYKWPFVPTIK